MKKTVFLLFLALLVCVSGLISLGIGRYGIGLSELFRLLFGTVAIDDVREWHNIFFQIRLPRILAAALVGGALSIAGATYQSIFTNPLVSPNILGVLAGSAFGAALGMLISDNWLFVQIMTFVCGFFAVVLALLIAGIFKRSSDPVLLLILGGIVAGALFSSLLSIVKYVADPYDKLPAIVYWLMGSLANADWPTLSRTWWLIVGGAMSLIFMGKYINILSLGEDEARSLGVNTTVIRIVAILLATLVSTLTVVIGGEIGWVGLIIPHIARFIVGPDNRFLLIASALLGALFLIIVDTFSRTLFTVEVPIGVVTSLLGIVFFVFVLGRIKKGWS